MRMCPTHYDGLRSAIEERGLGQFISKDADQLVARIKKELENAGIKVSKPPDSVDSKFLLVDLPSTFPSDHKPTLETWDPLNNALLAIMNNALEAGGRYLLGTDEKGNPFCPICESEKHGGKPASWWFENAADEQVRRGVSFGVVGTA